MEELSLGIEDDDLTARPETGVEGEDPFLTEGRGEEELAEVVGEDPDRLGVGPFFGGQANLRFHGVGKEPPVGVFDGHPDLYGGGPASLDEKGVEDHKASASGGTTRRVRNSSFSPRRMARTRWEGALAAGSSQSK